jgi:hypothetical protein
MEILRLSLVMVTGPGCVAMSSFKVIDENRIAIDTPIINPQELNYGK